jgi:EcsC protein family
MPSVSQLDQVGRPPQSLWDRILAEPDRAPEHIALAASERFGPAAAEWVRVAGAGQTPEKLAKIAYRKHVRLARLEGGALGVGGIVTAAPDLVAFLWIESRMVFYVAAAYGYDPRHPMRPAELLALLDLYATPEDARKALDGIGKHLAQAAAERALRSGDRTGLHLRLARYMAKRLTRHYAARLIPLIGAPIGAMQNAGAAKQLGKRALAYYGGG